MFCHTFLQLFAIRIWAIIRIKALFIQETQSVKYCSLKWSCFTCFVKNNVRSFPTLRYFALLMDKHVQHEDVVIICPFFIWKNVICCLSNLILTPRSKHWVKRNAHVRVFLILRLFTSATRVLGWEVKSPSIRLLPFFLFHESEALKLKANY